jgi:hypothetical protein
LLNAIEPAKPHRFTRLRASTEGDVIVEVE